jgi:hypothetical protein
MVGWLVCILAEILTSATCPLLSEGLQPELSVNLISLMHDIRIPIINL